MLFVFVKLVVATMGLACLAASLLTWKDGASLTKGPTWWTIGYALFCAAALLTLGAASPLLVFVQLTLLNAAITFQLYGFAKHYQLPGRWPLGPLLGAGTILAWASALGVVADLHLQQVLAVSFFPFVLVGGSLHLVLSFRKHPGFRPVDHLVALGLLSAVGLIRFGQALVWKDSWFWFLGGPGSYFVALMVLVNLAAVAFYQLRLVNRGYLDRIGGMDRELAHSQREILLTLAEVIENSSHETAGHVARVGRHALTLARLVGLEEAEARLVAEAAHLHDIGKIGIPDRIMDHEGPLSEADRAVMATHTTLGHEILSGSDRPLFQTAARVALEHHENWDGTGYPRGLTGDQISLAGRIVALCDVFDALSQPRTYKEAWSRDRILAYLADQRGRKFDPRLVDLLLANVGRFP